MNIDQERALLGLDGKVALVTGGGAGIGREIVERFSALGMRVAVIEIDPARVEALRTEMLDCDHLVVQGDADDPQLAARTLAQIDAQFGRLDVLVNNVGDFLAIRNRFEETDEDQWERLYRVNLRNAFVMARAAIPLLRRQGGSIVNLSTIEAFRGIPRHVIYATFKAALTGFTESLAVELGPDGIRVNAIAPETTNSAQVRAISRVPPENADYVKRWFPIGRFGTPGDSAGAAVFLASDVLSGWISGTTIHVDGGALAAGSWLQLPDGGWTHLPIIDRDGYVPPRRD